MIAVLFEVKPKVGAMASYLDLAEALKQSLERIEGFISVERFQSLVEPEKYLSLSYWENESAIKEWKANLKHHSAQKKGKEELFDYYRIRVATVLREYDSES